MSEKMPMQLLINRKMLCKLLGDVSISHIIRMERYGNLAATRIQIGKRAVRYNLVEVRKLIESKQLV